MNDKYILAGMLSAVCLNNTQHGVLDCTTAANALHQNGVRVVVTCKRCANFVPTQGHVGWCNHCFGPRGFNDFCSHGERRSKHDL